MISKNPFQSHSTAQIGESAKDIRTLRNLSSKLVVCEERDRFFGNLTRLGIGVKEVEDFVKNNIEKLKNQNKNLKGKLRRELVAKAMDIKDNKGDLKKVGRTNKLERRNVKTVTEYLSIKILTKTDRKDKQTM